MFYKNGNIKDAKAPFHLKNASNGCVRAADSVRCAGNIHRWCAVPWVVLCIDNHLRVYISTLSGSLVTYMFEQN